MKILFVALALAASPLAAAADACQTQLPVAMRSAVEAAFPSYRTPVVTDNLPDDVEWSLRQKGNGCLGVAIADFDGDGKRDFLLGLTERNGSGATVVVALADGAKWTLHQLDQWKDGRSRLYVSAGKPDTYKRTEALSGPLGVGELSPLTCKTSFAVFGTTESTGVAYCYQNNHWVHVWIAD
jgi:hypothetical protein